MIFVRKSLIFAILCLIPAANLLAIPLPETRAEALRLERGVRQLENCRQISRNESFSNGTHTEYLEYSLTATSLPVDSMTMHVTHRLRVDSSSIDHYLFNLGDARIVSLQIDGSSRPYLRSGDEISVELDTPRVASERFEMTVSYRIDVLPVGYGGGMQYSSSENVLFTNGEPFDTRRWLACWDYPDAKIDTVVSRVRLPDPYKVLSNGELISSAPDSVARTWVWRSTDPISSYLISIAAHNYHVHEAGVTGINDTPVAYWVYPSDSTDQIYDYGRTPEMIALFETLFGVYPFNKYDQATAPIFGGGGAMEHQTATTYGSSLVGDGQRRYERVVAHELAHQWWGNSVGPKDFRNIWLNEGFASYAEILWHESTDSTLMHQALWSQASDYFAEDGGGARFPLYNPPDGYLFSTTVYKKGSRVLHMLRWELGDSSFFEGLRTYASEYYHGNANTADFQAVMEVASGENLDPFFQQWIYSGGYPILAFSDITIMESASGWQAEIRVNQTQLDAPLFAFDLPLQLSSENEDTMVSVSIESVREQTLIIDNIEFKPVRVDVDPEDWILLRSNLGTLTEGPLPQLFTLSKAYPNPFNTTVRATIAVHRPGVVDVSVFNLLGEHLATVETLTRPGVYPVVWRPQVGTASGMYLLRASSGTESQARKLLLIR